MPLTIAERFPHYFKDVSLFKKVDVYRILVLFGVTDPNLQHAIKKLLVAGGRGNKDINKDVEEAIVTLQRWQEMREEEKLPYGLVQASGAEIQLPRRPQGSPGVTGATGPMRTMFTWDESREVRRPWPLPGATGPQGPQGEQSHMFGYVNDGPTVKVP